MSLFADTTRPRVFAVPPGAAFAERFAEGFRARSHALPGPELAATQIMVNAGRTLQEIERALATAQGSGLLPRLSLLTALAETQPTRPDLPPALSSLRRHLHLTRLVERYLEAAIRAGTTLAPLSAASDLADALALLIDQFHDEGIDPAAMTSELARDTLTPDSAQHWERSLEFVDIVRKIWPAIRAETEQGALDPRARQRAVVDAMVATWQQDPARHPLISAGSTGSVKSTAVLMAAIAGLPQGCVVLPGFDPDIDPSIWDAAGADHPLGPFRNLLDLLDIAPHDVQQWVPSVPTPRTRLFAQAMRPAPVTDHWYRAAPDLVVEIAEATSGLSLLEAESPRHEASAIAIAIRKALETADQTVAVVTPDAMLARRLSASLGQFAIVPDDSLGKPLAQSPPAVVLRMIAEIADGRRDPVRLASLLNHPIIRPGLGRGLHLALARAYESDVLRKGPQGETAQAFPRWSTDDQDAQAWLMRINQAIALLSGPLERNAPLGDLVAAHIEAANILSDAGTGAPAEIWQGTAGEQLQTFLHRLLRDASAFGPDPVPDYAALVRSVLRNEQQRPEQQTTHPRVSIWGPREARILKADVLILAGLNDGVWPEPPPPDPWLSRPMRAEIGLPAPERTVGLSAHDFLQAVCQPNVLLTRARKIDGTPTVASRWLIRLENLMSGIGGGNAFTEMRDRGAALLSLVEHIDRPDHPVDPAKRPQPAPPVPARPRQLSVTQIETLIRDAYAIYARHVLRLKPLDPLGRAPDYRERGIAMHTMMEIFTQRTQPWPGADLARQVLDEVAHDVLHREVPWPDLRRIWKARIDRFADWFITQEHQRRGAAHPFRPEQTGSLVLDLPAGPFTLTAKADRIDRLHAGGAAVYDYKTGAPPTKKQIEQGFNQQLHVQAAILAKGGFQGIPALEAKSGAFIGLTGSEPGGKEVQFDDLHASVAQHMAQLVDLLAAYDRGAPYLSHGRAQFESHEGDYDHLARRGEWEGEDDP